MLATDVPPPPADATPPPLIDTQPPTSNITLSGADDDKSAAVPDPSRPILDAHLSRDDSRPVVFLLGFGIVVIIWITRIIKHARDARAKRDEK